MVLLEPTGFPVFTQRPGSSVIWRRNLSIHAWQHGMNFAFSAQTTWGFTSRAPQELHAGSGSQGMAQRAPGNLCLAGIAIYGHRCIFFSCCGPFPQGNPFHPSTTKAQKTLQANRAHIISFAISWWGKWSAMNFLRSQSSADSNKLWISLSNQTVWILHMSQFNNTPSWFVQILGNSWVLFPSLCGHMVWALPCTNISAQNCSIWCFAGKSLPSSAGAELHSGLYPSILRWFCHLLSLFSLQPLHSVLPDLFRGLEEHKEYLVIKIWAKSYSEVKQSPDMLKHCWLATHINLQHTDVPKEPLSVSFSNQADYWKLGGFISSTSRNFPLSGDNPFWQLWVRVKGRKSDRFVWLENKTRENTSATSYMLK